MAKQHVDIFKALGLSKKDIDAIEALTEDKLGEWKPDEVVESIRGSVRKVLENDHSFLDSLTEEKIPKLSKAIEKNQYARFQNELIDVWTKDLGLDEKELNADDRGSIRKLTNKIATTYLAKKGTVEGLQKINDELNKVKGELAKNNEDWEAKVKTETEGITTKYSSKIKKTLLQSDLASLDKVKLHIAAGYVADPVMNELNSLYKVVLTDNDELDIMQKENDKLPVTDKAGKKVPFRDALRQIVLDKKFGVEEKEGPVGQNEKKKVVIGAKEGEPGETEEIKVADYIQAEIDKQLALEEKK